jgi:hypothetical protein
MRVKASAKKSCGVGGRTTWPIRVLAMLLVTVLSSCAGSSREPPIHAAIWASSTSEAAKLIRGADDANIFDQHGDTPLMIAAFKGNVEIAKLLIAKGAKVDLKSANGITALHVAATQGQAGVAEVLINRGSDVQAKTNEGLTPLFLAATRGNNPGYEKVIELLLRAGATPDSLWACDSGLASLKETLRQAEADYTRRGSVLNQMGFWDSVAGPGMGLGMAVATGGVNRANVDELARKVLAAENNCKIYQRRFNQVGQKAQHFERGRRMEPVGVAEPQRSSKQGGQEAQQFGKRPKLEPAGAAGPPPIQLFRN